MMTAPIWMASPPEIHSALLSSGLGPGPLLAAATAWSSLSIEYTTAADELTALLGAVQAGTWQGSSAQAYLAAHAPYLAWLTEASAASAAMATRQETAATAYTAALAAMPTLAELAANHATHAMLVGTNFFGVNTIPIALNEADYARMWVQAATVMAGYHTTAGTAVATAPQPPAAPAVVKVHPPATAATESTPTNPPGWFVNFENFLQGLFPQPSYPNTGDFPIYSQLTAFFNKIGFTEAWDPFAHFFTGLNGSSLLPPPGVPGSWLAFTGDPLHYFNPGTIAYFLSVPLDPGSYAAFVGITITDDLLAILYTAVFNPQGFALVAPLAMVEIVGSTIADTIQLLHYLLEPAIALIPALLPAVGVSIVPLAASPLAGLSGLAGLAALHPVAVLPVAPSPPMAMAPTAPPTPVPAPTPAPAPTPVSVPPAAAPPAGASAPPPVPAGPPVVGMEAYLYMVGGLSAASRRAAGSSARKKKAPEPDNAGEPVPEAAVREPAQRPRRAKASMLGRGHEYMDLAMPEPSASSGRGAEWHGLARGTHRVAAARPTGLSTLAGDPVDGGVSNPMLPNTWGRGSD